MSTKKIDELFRSKLADHAATPGADAWAKLQGKMNPPQNSKGFFWMPIAAAVALLILAGWLTLRQSNNSGGLSETLAEQTVSGQPVPADSTQNMNSEIKNAREPQLAANGVEVAPVEQAGAVIKKKNKPTMQPTPLRVASEKQSNGEAIAQVTPETTTSEAGSTKGEVAKVVEIPEIVADQVANRLAEIPMETPEVKITFIADDDERFLQPVKDLIASEAAKEKKNGLGKLIASARTLSNREILAELRDSKDELFNGNVRLGIIKNEKGQ